MIIKLQGSFGTIIDDQDFELIKDYKWSASYQPKPKTYYAIANIVNDNGVNTTLRMHRLILDASRGSDVDHKNHNGLDNRRENIRECTRTQNMYNTRKFSTNTTGYKGVYFHKKIK